MTPRHWVASGGVKIERAKEHIRDFEAAEADFGKTDPYEIVTDNESHPGWIIYRLKIHRHPPRRLGAIGADAIHNLRSALDHLMQQVRHPDGGGRSSTGGGFILFETAEEFEDHFRRAVKPKDKRIVEALREIKPHKGGNPALWEINALDIVDKHHLLIPVSGASVIGKITVNVPGKGPTVFNDLAGQRLLYPLKDGAELGRLVIGKGASISQVDVDPEFRFFVTLSEGEILKGQPLVPLLTALAGEMDRVAETFIRAELLT